MESGREMVWVEGQYQQCAYGGKMLGHWGKGGGNQMHWVFAGPSADQPSTEVVII